MKSLTEAQLKALLEEAWRKGLRTDTYFKTDKEVLEEREEFLQQLIDGV